MADTEVLRVRLSAEGVAEVVGALKAAGTQSKKEAQNVEQAWGGASHALEGFHRALGALGLAAGVGELIAFAKGSAEMAKELNEATEKLGGTTTGAAGLALVFRQAGVDINSANAPMAALAKNSRDFEQGGGRAAKAFHELGLTAKDFSGLDLQQRLVVVSKALAQYAGGADKAALATEVLGRKGLALIPAMNRLATEGMDEVLKRMNLLFSPEAVKAAGDFAERMTRAGFALQGVGLNFVAGLAEPLTKAFDDIEGQVSGGLVVSIQRVGAVAGTFVADLLKGLGLIGNSADETAAKMEGLAKVIGTIGRVLSVVIAAFDVVAVGIGQAFEDSYARVSAVFKAFQTLISHPFKSPELLQEQLDAENDRLDAGIEKRKKAIDGLTAAWDRLLHPPPLPPTPAELIGPPASAAPKPGENRPDQPDKSDALKAASDRADAELTVTKATIKDLEDLWNGYYKDGQISAKENADIRLALLERERQAEVAAIIARAKSARADVESASTTAEKAKAEKDLAKAQTDLSLLEMTTAANVRRIHRESTDEQKRASRQLIDDEVRLNSSRETEHRAEVARIADEAQKRHDLVVQAGGDLTGAALQAEADRQARHVTDTETGKLTAKEAFTDARNALDALAADEQQIQQTRQNGLLAEASAQALLIEQAKERLPELQRLADVARDTANATGDPTAIEHARALADEITNIRQQIEAARGSFRLFVATAANAGQAGLTDALANLGHGAQTAGDAFRQFAFTVGSAVQRLAAQIISSNIISLLLRIFGAAGGVVGGGGTTGTASAASGGIQEQQPFAEGGIVGGPGASMSAAGLVRGPGGPTADRIPALLSHGEHVTRAAVVGQPGAATFLAHFNVHGMSTVWDWAARNPQRFAEGGLAIDGSHTFDARSMASPSEWATRTAPAIPAANSDPGSLMQSRTRVEGRIEVGLDDGLVLRTLKTPAGRAVIVDAIQKTRRTVGSILRR